MYQAHEHAYLESRVYSASPSGLVHILYETALDSVRHALEATSAQDIAGRARAISRASSCLMELAGSLNVEVGGSLGIRLASLYEYLLHELLTASAQQSEESLRNCERVLAPLLEGWTQAMETMEHSEHVFTAPEVEVTPDSIDAEDTPIGVGGISWNA
jgi:flagellar protein FliS